MNGFNINDLWLIAPMLVVSGGSLLLLLLDVFVRRPWPRSLFAAAVFLVALPYIMQTYSLTVPGQTIFSGMLFADPFANFFSFLLIVGSVLVLLLGVGRLKEQGIENEGEYYALLLMSTVGAIVFVSAAEMITMFLGLELMSMALYCLCGSARMNRNSIESALKYFLLGSFSSAFLLYGMALLYGLTGSTQIMEMVAALPEADVGLTLMGMGLILVGLLFKIGIVPFHFWTPDVYQGAPTPVTVYMACVIKAAAVGTALRVVWTVFPEFYEQWSGFLWLLAVLTMVLANLVALRQRSLKRMLAYSSIGHAGYMLMAFLAPGEAQGGSAILFYLVVYTLMTVGAFAVLLTLVRDEESTVPHDDIRRFNGFGYEHPVLGGLMALFMFSMAGIPPGMAGLLGKFYLFSSVVSAGFVGLAIIGVLCAAVSCYYYLRVIVAMYFIEPDGDVVAVSVDSALWGALFICAVGVVLLGVFPGSLHVGIQQVIASF